MAIEILKIYRSKGDFTLAEVRHGESTLKMFVEGNKKSLSKLVGESITAEIDYDQVHRWAEIADYDDKMSGVYPADNPETFIIRGKVSDKTEVGDGIYIMDVYLANEADWLAVDSDQLGGEILEADTGLELEVSDLRFYPTDA